MARDTRRMTNRGSTVLRNSEVWDAAARAIAATGTPEHVECLIDLVGAGIPHDFVTVTRYSRSGPPEFVAHRRFSDRMVERYLSDYYVFDPFHEAWRRDRRLGVVPLKAFEDAEMRRGRYIAEFLAQSQICDEVGVLLEDGGDWCLGIFLDRSTRRYRDTEIAALTERLPAIEALHALDLRTQSPGFRRGPSHGSAHTASPVLPEGLWPDLTPRERELVQLVLAGHPTAAIAQKLGIAVGTVKNHRLKIYAKLDITSERELFLEYFNSGL